MTSFPGIVLIILIYLLITIIWSRRQHYETFQSSDPILFKSIDDLKWGQLNQIDSNLIRNHQILLFKLPLPLNQIQPPPKNSNPDVRRELTLVREMSQGLTQPQKESILKLQTSVVDQFTNYCQSQKLLFNRSYLNQVSKDIKCLTLQLKGYFNRPRPYQLSYYLHQNVLPLPMAGSDSPSYPSFRTLEAKTLANVISYNNPDHATQLHAIAKQVELSRLMGGYNYPSDNRASLEIALILKKAMKYWENSDFHDNTKKYFSNPDQF
jgi:hypothetical protein